MIDHLFRAHPRSVGESYGEHFGVASRFGLTMIAGGIGALVHALVPALCERTGSATVRRLHAQLHGRSAADGEVAHPAPGNAIEHPSVGTQA